VLDDRKPHPSLATADIGTAKAWYAEKLGWTPKVDLPQVLVYEVDGSTLTVFPSPNARTAQNTVAIWAVRDLRSKVAELKGRGVEFPDFDNDEHEMAGGIHADENGVLNAWFQDADGNWISIVEDPRPSEVDDQVGINLMLAASDVPRARDWYADKLGYAVFHDYGDEEVVMGQGRNRFSIYRAPSGQTARNTVGMWWVDDLRAEMADLRARGVVFEDYDFGDARTVDGVMSDEGGMTAWFKDSEGNILGLGQYRDLRPD
jgi:catechol 2,3-dioxygenase-like lactoylglutathione lyase family enzyme